MHQFIYMQSYSLLSMGIHNNSKVYDERGRSDPQLRGSTMWQIVGGLRQRCYLASRRSSDYPRLRAKFMGLEYASINSGLDLSNSGS